MTFFYFIFADVFYSDVSIESNKNIMHFELMQTFCNLSCLTKTTLQNAYFHPRNPYFLNWKNEKVDETMNWDSSKKLFTRVAASERKSVGSPSVLHRRKQFQPIIPLRRIGTESYFEKPIRSDKPTDYMHA